MTMVSTKSQDDEEKTKVNLSFYHFLELNFEDKWSFGLNQYNKHDRIIKCQRKKFTIDIFRVEWGII